MRKRLTTWCKRRDWGQGELSGAGKRLPLVRCALRVMLFAAALPVVLTPSARADWQYSYTGNVLSGIVGSYTCANCDVTFSFVVAGALGDNLNNVSVTPLSFSIFDGERGWTQATGKLSDQKAVNELQVSTGASGAITQWDFLVNTLTNSDGISSWDGLCPGCAFPIGDITYHNSPTPSWEADSKNNPGTWSAMDLTPVPEPSLTGLLVLMVTALCIAGRFLQALR
jgi:hypothetical protein